MANKQLLRSKNILDTRLNNSWLHNTYVLYFIFIVALGYAYYLMASSDWYYLSVLFILCFLTSFFSKNIIVILCIGLGATNILKYGIKATMEGFEEKEGLEVKPKKDYSNEEDENFEDNSEKTTLESEEVKYENPTEESRKKKKDNFVSKPDGVYTTDEDMDITKVYDDKDHIIKNQERILKNLNQYKPLLDTINSITKSVSSFKNR